MTCGEEGVAVEHGAYTIRCRVAGVARGHVAACRPRPLIPFLILHNTGAGSTAEGACRDSIRRGQEATGHPRDGGCKRLARPSRPQAHSVLRGTGLKQEFRLHCPEAPRISQGGELCLHAHVLAGAIGP